VLIGDNGFFQGMFQSVTGIPTIDSHFVLALPVTQHNWFSPPLIHISLTKLSKGDIMVVSSEVHSKA
jgi:hypothetical protein